MLQNLLEAEAEAVRGIVIEIGMVAQRPHLRLVRAIVGSVISHVIEWLCLNAAHRISREAVLFQRYLGWLIQIEQVSALDIEEDSGHAVLALPVEFLEN